MEPDAILEINWPGGSGLSDGQLMQIHEFMKEGLITGFFNTPNKWILEFDDEIIPYLETDVPWLYELIEQQQKKFNDSLN